MALYVDCAYLADIEQVRNAVPIAGVTTNPSIMLAAWERGQRLGPGELLIRLLDTVGGDVYIQPGATGGEEMLREVMSYIETDPDRVIPKIPMTREGLKVALRLKEQGRRIAFTAVTTVAQAYVGAMSGATCVIPYYNRLARCGVDASERVAHMAELLHNQQAETRILAASIKSVVEASDALQAGAHDLTMAPQVLLEMVTDPQSEEAVERFSQDWTRMKKL